MSACLGGEIAQTLEKNGVAAAEEVAKEYAAMFAPGDFYLELMPTPTPEQETLNGELVRMGKKLGIPLVATNDCHYVNRSDAAAHDVLMAIQTGKSLKDEKRLKHVVDSYYMKSPAEMDAAFKDVAEAIENTAAIAARCNVKLKLDQTLPADLQGPRRRDARHRTSASSSTRASSAGSGELHRRAASRSIPTSTASAARPSSP